MKAGVELACPGLALDGLRPEGGKGEAAFDALMTQLMGGDVPGEEFADPSGIQVWTPGAEVGERANIFEYATLRYRRLSLEDKRLGGTPPLPATADRALASAKP